MNIGDEEDFENFLEDESNTEGQEDNQLSFIINTLKFKIDAISDLYNTTITNYQKIPEIDPVKTILKDYIEKLIGLSLQALNQFDYTLIDDEDSENDEE